MNLKLPKLFRRRRGVDLSMSKVAPKITRNGPFVIINDDPLYACVDLAEYESKDQWKENFEKKKKYSNFKGLEYKGAEPWKNGKVIINNENRNI